MTLLEDVKQRLDIESIVSGYVTLTPSGSNFRAPCPFHAERTPSFFVFIEKQTWRCFGACADGGDAISFIMRIESMTFVEALRVLADRFGIERSTPQSVDEISSIHRVNKIAARFFHKNLIESADGTSTLAYLSERGISMETITSFELGLSPRGPGKLAAHLQENGVSTDLAARSGVVSRTQDGRTREFFQGRLMFPIKDKSGLIVGFGGRALDGGQPKYLNSSRTKVFDKSRLLYAIDKAAGPIAEEQVGVIVEGYMDALMAHQKGFTNVVASMGTAITRDQSRQLVDLAPKFVLALDPDTAGQEATLRSLEGSWQAFQPPSLKRDPAAKRLVDTSQQVVWLSVAVLPEGQDPHDLIGLNPEGWRRAINESLGLVEFLFDVLPKRYDMESPDGKLAFLERIVGLILTTQDHRKQDSYMEQLEHLFGINRRTLEELIGVNRRQLLIKQRGNDFRQSRNSVNLPMGSLTDNDPLEEYTLALLLKDELLRQQADTLQPEYFQRSENREVFRSWLDCSTMDELKTKVEGVLLDSLTSLNDRFLPPMDAKERAGALVQCVRRLEERYLRELKSQEGFLQSQSEVAPKDSEEILGQLRQRNARLRGLFASKSRDT